MNSYNLILIRHGQSQWNKQNRFTGWTDIDLSLQGKQEALKAAELLKKNNFYCDIAYTSVLKRAIRTLWIILDNNNHMWVPVIKAWQLNERHYGSLTGLNKAETIKKYGEQQVTLWRRDYKTIPPILTSSDQIQKKCYEDITHLPTGESLQQTKQRVIPFWNNTIAPQIKKNKKILIVAHGNSLRALIKHIENLSDEKIMTVEIPTATSIAYTISTKNLELINTRQTLN